MKFEQRMNESLFVNPVYFLGEVDEYRTTADPLGPTKAWVEQHLFTYGFSFTRYSLVHLNDIERAKDGVAEFFNTKLQVYMNHKFTVVASPGGDDPKVIYQGECIKEACEVITDHSSNNDYKDAL